MSFDFQNDLTFSDSGPSAATDAAFSPDGSYLAIACSVTTSANTNNLPLYKKSGSQFVRLAQPDFLPSSFVRGVCFSPDGNYLAVAWQGAAGLWIFKRNGDAFNRVATGTTTQSALSVDWSPDGTKIAVGTTNNANVIMCVFEWDQATESLTKATVDQMTLGSTPQGRVVRWAPNSLYCYLHDTGNKCTYLTQFNPGTGTWAVGTYKVLSSVTNWMALSKNGSYLAVAMTSAPYLAVYKFDPSNGLLWDLAVPTLHAGTRRCVRFLEGTGGVPHILVTGDQIPRAEIFSIVSDVVTDTGYTFASIPALPLPAAQIAPRELNLLLLTASSGALYTDQAKVSKVTFPTFQVAGEGEYILGESLDVTGEIGFPGFTSAALVGLSEPEVFPGPTFLIDAASVQAEVEGIAFEATFSESGDVVVVPPFTILPAYGQVDGEGATISEVASQPFTYGHPRFPHFGVAGDVLVHDDAEITISFPAFTASGTGGSPVTGTATVRFGVFSADGEGAIPEGSFASLRAVFPGFGGAGEGEVPFGARGDLLAFPGFTVAGVATQPVNVTGTLAFPHLATSGFAGPDNLLGGSFAFSGLGAAGLGGVTGQIEGALAFPGFSVDANFRIVHPVEISGTPRFPIFRASGEAVLPTIVGEITFPAFGASGYVKLPVQIRGALAFPALKFSGAVARPLHVDVLARFPRFGVQGRAGFPIHGSGQARFPVFKARIRVTGLPAEGAAGFLLGLSESDGFNINPQIKFGRINIRGA